MLYYLIQIKNSRIRPRYSHYCRESNPFQNGLLICEFKGIIPLWCLTTWSVNTSIPWHISQQAHQFEKPLYRVMLLIWENFFTRTLRYEKSYLSFLKFSMNVWGRPEPIYSPSSTFFHFKKYFCPLYVSFRKVSMYKARYLIIFSSSSFCFCFIALFRFFFNCSWYSSFILLNSKSIFLFWQFCLKCPNFEQ